MTRPSTPLVVFLGPSLPVKEARRCGDCVIWPPAAQGDIWRALALRPRAMALVDGVFEARPSVWHKELLAALDAGVAVFGGASMGALRAAELGPYGMVGVGEIFRWYRDGVVRDDSEVALLHADAEHEHRPLTLPLVNVRHAARQARAARVLRPKEAEQLVEVATAIFYQERTWAKVVRRLREAWPASTLKRWQQFSAAGMEDLKARDARECIATAVAYAAAGLPASGAIRPLMASSLVRRRRFAAWIEALRSLPEADELARRGLGRLMLSRWAESQGLSASLAVRSQARRRWLSAAGVSAAHRNEFLAAAGLDEAMGSRFEEELALEQLALGHAPRLLPDGPSWEEGLVFEAIYSGRLAVRGRGSGRR